MFIFCSSLNKDRQTERNLTIMTINDINKTSELKMQHPLQHVFLLLDIQIGQCMCVLMFLSIVKSTEYADDFFCFFAVLFFINY